MELVRAFTTRQPAVGSSAAGGGTTLQRNITIYVLVAGIAGGLFLVMTILLLCKYCKRSRSFRFGCLKGAGSRSQNHLAAKPIDENKEAETSFIREKINNNGSSSGRAGVEVLPRRSSVGHTSKQKKSSAGPSQTTASSPAALLALPHHTTGLEPGSTGISTADGSTNDSYVIQVEPIRVIAASPLPDDFSWVSDDSQKQHGRLTVKADITTENWKRLGRDNSPGSANRRSLQHAASHPTSSQDSSSVSKRRSDWRNSHRNYRSTPTSTTASRDAHNVNVLVTYEARRALRDPGPSSTPTADLSGSSYSGSPSAGSSSTRRLLPKRAGSMRENPGEHLQQRSGGLRNSPSNKRWRCNTVDYPSSPGPLINNPAGIISKEMLIIESESSLSCQRHSFPNSGDQPAIHQSRHQQSQHHRQHSGARPKELFYDMNHSESLDWIGFQSNRRESIGLDDENDDTEDASISQQSTLTAGPAPKITIRYNDPGSLESVNEDNLFFCLEADNKKEFRQRLEKTIHVKGFSIYKFRPLTVMNLIEELREQAQYRQVWELRANLEEHNEFYELPSSPEPEMINIGDAEMPSVRHSASFDSNPEILPDEVTEAKDLINTSNLTDGELTSNKTPGLLYPTTSSGMWKRQSYRSIAINSRHQRLQHNLQTSPNNQPQSSFDSIDTIETSSTDASRLDQVTTSFESSATDSTNGPEQTAQQQSSGVNRMLASRGDSGYKSLESSAIPTNRPRLAKSLATTRSEGGTLDYISHPDCQCEGDLHDEKCERDKPIVFARCTRYGLAKSRSASTGGGGNMFLQPPSPAPPPAPVSQPVVGWKQQPRRLPTMLARDYSIDERTDALFREFSRCDPVYDGTVTRQPTFGRKDLLRPAGFNRNRWINQQRHEHHQHRFLSLQSSDQTVGGVTTSTDGSDVPLLQQHSLKE